MATSINPLSSGLQTAMDPTAAATTTGVATKNTFLQLLVAQIKNQNPLNPTDATQFVAQLAQFSELEQTIGIRSAVEGMRSDLEQLMAAPQQNK